MNEYVDGMLTCLDREDVKREGDFPSADDDDDEEEEEDTEEWDEQPEAAEGAESVEVKDESAAYLDFLTEEVMSPACP